MHHGIGHMVGSPPPPGNVCIDVRVYERWRKCKQNWLHQHRHNVKVCRKHWYWHKYRETWTLRVSGSLRMYCRSSSTKRYWKLRRLKVPTSCRRNGRIAWPSPTNMASSSSEHQMVNNVHELPFCSQLFWDFFGRKGSFTLRKSEFPSQCRPI